MEFGKRFGRRIRCSVSGFGGCGVWLEVSVSGFRMCTFFFGCGVWFEVSVGSLCVMWGCAVLRVAEGGLFPWWRL